jgi:hypothetical protein
MDMKVINDEVSAILQEERRRDSTRQHFAPKLPDGWSYDKQAECLDGPAIRIYVGTSDVQVFAGLDGGGRIPWLVLRWLAFHGGCDE